MKAAIVKFSAIASSPRLRLDAGHYLGQYEGKAIEMQIETTRKRLRQAKRRLQILKAMQAAHQQRVAEMVASGELTLIGFDTT